MDIKRTKALHIPIENSWGIARSMQQLLLRENQVSRQAEQLWTIGLSMATQADDQVLTDRMIEAGNIVGIQMFDHIVINPKTEDYLSYRDVGLMDELSKGMA